MKKYFGLKRTLKVIEEYKGLVIVGGYKNNTYKVGVKQEVNGKTYIETGVGLHTYTSVGKAKEQINFYFANIDKMRAAKTYTTYKSYHF